MADLDEGQGVGSKTEVRQRKSRRELQAETEVEELRVLLKNPAFCDFVWRVLDKAGIYRTAFRGEATHTSSHAQGMQEVGRMVLEELLTADPNAYTMVRHVGMGRDLKRSGQG